MKYPLPMPMRASVLTGLLLLVACGTVNTTSTREGPATTAHSKQTQINDLLTQIFLHCRELRMFRTAGGPMEMQIDVNNDDFRQRNFAWRVDWLDAQGNVIPSTMSVWKSASVPSGGMTTLTSVAPGDAGVDFRLQVRRSD